MVTFFDSFQKKNVKMSLQLFDYFKACPTFTAVTTLHAEEQLKKLQTENKALRKIIKRIRKKRPSAPKKTKLGYKYGPAVTAKKGTHSKYCQFRK